MSSNNNFFQSINTTNSSTINISPTYSPETKTSNAILTENYQVSPCVSNTPQFATPINKLDFDNIPITPDITTRVIPTKNPQMNKFTTAEDGDYDISTLFNNEILNDKGNTFSGLGDMHSSNISTLGFSRTKSSGQFYKDIYGKTRQPLDEHTNLNIDSTVLGFKRKIGPVKNLFPKFTRGLIQSNFDPDVFQCDSLPELPSERENENKLSLKRIYSVPSYIGGDNTSSFPKPIVNLNGRSERLKSASEIPSEQLIGDLSRPHAFPLLAKRLNGLSYISDETLAEYMGGKYGRLDVLIIDCRYPYEYDGGHVKNAINIYTKDSVLTSFFKDPNILFKNASSGSTPILIFHCEYSSVRAPALARFLRNTDRNVHHSCYPKLYYPEVYILNGGYKQFFNNYNQYCEPQAYIPMDDVQYIDRQIFYNKQLKEDSADSSATSKVGIGRR